MVELDIGKTDVTNLANNLSDYSVDSQATDYADSGVDETTYSFPKATEYIGYYKSIPELKKAVDALAMWSVGKGYTTNNKSLVILDGLKGWGEDTFDSIIRNMIVVKKIVGDSFAEIIRNQETGTLINIKPISPERMRIVVGSNGLVKRYEQRGIDGSWKKFKPEDILHFSNERFADEIHGTSVIDACKWVIDARNEALTDYRKVLHRNVIPVRIIEIDTDDTTKRDVMIREYEDAIKKGEVLVLPKGTAEVKDNTITIQDPTNWIRYLENFFYQAVGIPKIILGGSEEFTEASSKIGYLTFEQVYITEQRYAEGDIWNQLGIDLQFERPVSLKDNMQNDEAANTGQVGFQPKEADVNLERE